MSIPVIVPDGEKPRELLRLVVMSNGRIDFQIGVGPNDPEIFSDFAVQIATMLGANLGSWGLSPIPEPSNLKAAP